MTPLIPLVVQLAVAVTAASPRFHKDDRFGAFEVEVPVPDFHPGYDRVLARSKDGKTFALFADYDEAEGDQARGVDKRTRPHVFGRFTDSGEAKVDIFVAPAQGPGTPRKVTTVSLSLPSHQVKAPEVLAAWADAQNAQLARDAGYQQSLGPDGYLVWRSSALYGAHVNPDPTWRRGGQTTNLYEVMSGYAAARETLQVDAMRRPDGSLGAGVALSSLKGPQLPSHPFEKMRGGRSPRMFEEAKAVPAQGWVLHVRSPDAAFQMMDLLDAWGTDLAHAMEGRAIDHGSKERLFTQLALPRSDLARSYAKQSVESLSLTGHDPFFREGTDLTLVFNARDAASLAKVLELTRSAKDARALREDYKGVTLSILATADRAVSSVLATSGRFVFLGNSTAGVKACLDALNGRAPSLASQHDFLYVRSLGDGGEDGFLYLSDAFVRNLTDPQMKIADQRRESCERNLKEIAYGRLLAQRDRRGPLSLEALVKEGYLAEGLSCAHGGHYTLDEHGPRCSVHGRPSFLTPLVELPVNGVTSAEADSYRAFVENYRTYWRQFLDPIAVRMKLGPPMVFDTVILPLVDNTIYSSMRGALSEKTAGLDRQGESQKTLVAISGAIAPTEGVQQFIGRFMRKNGLVGGDPWRWLGNRASLVLYDGDPIFTVDAGKFPLFAGRQENPVEALTLTAVLSALTLPSALVIELKDPVQGRLAIERMGAAIGKQLSRERGGFLSGSMESYRLEDPKGGDAIGVLSLEIAGIHFRLYYTVLGDQLYLATRRWLVEDMIRRGAVVPRDGADPQQGHYRVRIEHAHLKEALSAVQANWGEAMRDACFKNLPELELLREAGVMQSEAPGVLGFKSYCPAGGRYQVDDEGALACSVHGSPHAPRMPGALADQTSTVQWLDRFAELDFTLTLDAEGLSSHTVLTPRKP